MREIVTTNESLGDDERQILTDLFGATKRTLKEVMRPRSEVAFVRADDALTEAAAQVRDQPYSRYPVIGENFDDIVGLLHVRDLLDVTAEDERSVGEVRREILMLPSTNRLLPAVSTMRQTGHHLAVVVDEYGGTDGIVTLEDLVEEVVGEIFDEYDTASVPTAAGGMVDGRLNLQEFEEATGLELPRGSSDTIAGFITERLGRLAAVGDTVDVAGARLQVAAMDRRRIAGVRVLPQTAETADEETRDRPRPRAGA